MGAGAALGPAPATPPAKPPLPPAAPATISRRASGALDPRLLRYARSTRTFIVSSIALGTVGALLIVLQAWLLVDVVCEAFLHGRGLSALRGPLAGLLAVVLARAAVVWGGELLAKHSSTLAKSQLRSVLLRRASGLVPYGGLEERTGGLAVLASRGLDALDDYFALYLPQLVLAVIVPVVVLAAVLADDWVSAAIIAFTIPLIPLFMSLVGSLTKERTERELVSLQRLAGHFLDVVEGLATLKVFGRSRAQVSAIAEVTARYRANALRTLRVTFLSSLVLELVATLAVAVVAVAIGLRLTDGSLGLRAGLFALVLAPEAYLPLRRLGANYHASSAGVAAAEQAFAIIEAPAGDSRPESTCAGAGRPAPGAGAEIVVEAVTVAYPGRSRPALQDLSLAVRPGETLALAGPSGCGKSTLIGVLLGLVVPDRGVVRVGGIPLAEIDAAAWHAQLAWVPQRPYLFAGSVLDNVRAGRADASEADVRSALGAAGLLEVVEMLPRGMHTGLGQGGAGLSAGERQRLALARAFVRDTPLLLLDEPTAGLDGATESGVIETIRKIAAGRMVVIAAHRPALLALADRVLQLAPPGVTGP